MKTLQFVLFVALTFSTSVMAEISPEQARQDILSMIKEGSIKGEVLDSPNHKYNATLNVGITSYRADHRDLSVSLTSPLYMVSHGLFREQGVSFDSKFMIGNESYMIKREEAVEGPLTVVTYKVRNKLSLQDPRRTVVSKEELKIYTRRNGQLVKVIIQGQRSNGLNPRVFVPKHWEHPRSL